jgi:hypothetical protein
LGSTGVDGTGRAPTTGAVAAALVLEGVIADVISCFTSCFGLLDKSLNTSYTFVSKAALFSNTLVIFVFNSTL